ncbi:RGCVC family protein [Amycolatopsis palatopharyngis]|uniref:RGCVC family protein n=1 Tax=Amycolatopsis palatopharyngis TaxID=187982 RepID=UPI000E27EBD8|nr:RGCVC family protein [Amycolatopsis palatopharyngis]
MPTTDANPSASSTGEYRTNGCAACDHPLSTHDQIANRFCRATTAGSYRRGCVCTTRNKS